MVNNNLKKLRGNLKQKTIAKQIGITQQQYSYIERSDRNPSLEIALKLSYFFNTPIEEIFFINADNKTLSKTNSKEAV